ncbi:hypothetical protein M5K25_003564 [Dendrobium thyrsiflorum]|uniref:Uncharacterized protein n=1 Tax=Dendrobium thyrsiflorum TaxID=117978 RepID=A0ABD0VKK1_DENTH
MVGEWMIDPIKIPWFRHPGSSWSLVYLVRGGSRPNLTEGSSSAAMGCFVRGYLVDRGFDVIGEHTGAGHDHSIVMPFGGESPGSEGPEQNFGSLPASPPFRGKLRETGPPATLEKNVHVVYIHPRLVVGAAPDSHPTALEKSAHRRFSGPSRTTRTRIFEFRNYTFAG